MMSHQEHTLSGLDLLAETFTPVQLNTGTQPLHKNVVALGRILTAIQYGNLTVNGLLPDDDYALGEYLLHGGRIRFDLTELSIEKQIELKTLLFPIETLYPRAFATHRLGGKDANGNLAEVKSGLFGAIIDAFNYYILGQTKHYGMDLPIGGLGKKHNGQTIHADGQWGHLYAHFDNHFMMIGIEPSAPGKTNLRTQAKHSKVGKSDKYSPFLSLKIDDKALHDQQKAEGCCPLSTQSKYNWACVKINDQAFEKIKAEASLIHRHTNPELIQNKLLGQRPHNAQTVPQKDVEKRLSLMKNFQKSTNKSASIRQWALLGSVTLAMLGLVMTLAPIPGLQVIGLAMMNIGFKAAWAATLFTIASGILGGITGASIRHLQAESAKKKYDKELAQVELQPIQVIKVNEDLQKSSSHSNAPIANLLGVPVAATGAANSNADEDDIDSLYDDVPSASCSYASTDESDNDDSIVHVPHQHQIIQPL